MVRKKIGMPDRKYNGKQALCIASVASNLDNFNRNNVDILLRLGYEVTLAANFHTKEDINSQEKIDAFAKEMRAKGVHVEHIDFSRKVSNLLMQLKSMKQVRKLLKRRYDFIHCHSPICAAIVRVSARKYRRQCRTRVLYTAHGFHFYKGAPIKNWLMFFPVEYICAYWTDVLITINKEDYKRAKEYFHAEKIVYIPGVGVDTKRFGSYNHRDEIRKELGIPQEALLLVSVGELNRNKNHSVVIRAVAKVENLNIHYAIAGKGLLRDELKALAESLNVGKQVHILGFRTDIPELYSAADICIFPSIREGLPVAAIEGMASGLPLIVSDNRGTKEFQAEDATITCRYDDVDGFAKAILKLAGDPVLRKNMGEANRIKSADFDASVVMRKMVTLYEEKK